MASSPLDQIITVDDEGRVLCGWFVLCENVAVGVVAHPAFEVVPCCDRCARREGSDLCRGTVELDRGEGVAS